MGKHVPFWIGVFVTLLIAIPIAVGAWGVATERALSVATVAFVVVVVLLVILVAVLFLRDLILRRVLGRTEVSLDEVAQSLVSGVSAAVTGDKARAEQEAKVLVRKTMGWYAWSNFYRWVITTAVAILLAFATFTGTVLLFEQTQNLSVQTKRVGEQTDLMIAQTKTMEAQTKRMEEQAIQSQMQNEILTLSLVSQLRDQLKGQARSWTVIEFVTRANVGLTRNFSLWEEEADCQLKFDPEHTLRSPPNAATRNTIADLARNGMLADRVQQALRFLLRDGDSAVVLGAMMVLDDLGMEDEADDPINLSGLAFRHVSLKQPWNLRVEESYISNLTCPKCEVQISGSVVEILHVQKATGGLNVELNMRRSSPITEDPAGIPTISIARLANDKRNGTALKFSGVEISQFATPFATYRQDADVCDLFGYYRNEGALFVIE